MVNDLDRHHFGSRRFSPSYVAGVEVASTAKAYPFGMAKDAQAINDTLDDLPVAVVVNPATQAVAVYLRIVDRQILTLRWAGDALVDSETGSQWDPVNGPAVSGPLRGSALRPLPYVPAYEGSWFDCYPQSELYSAR
jgi:hypothetical protein